MFGLFKSKPLLDESSTEWLFHAYAWALTNFGSDIFHRDTILVAPSNRHFPEKQLATPQQKVAAAFGRVRDYAGMQGWPCELIALVPDMEPLPPPNLSSVTPRGPQGAVTIHQEKQSIPIAFDPGMISKPLVLVAAFAQQLAYHLGRSIKKEVPGGEALRGPASDLLAVYMGFGLFMANSAMTACRGGCSGCAPVQKLGYLTEAEFVYALAIFCVLKDVQYEKVEPYLKKTLLPFFRKALKEINETRSEDIQRLKML